MYFEQLRRLSLGFVGAPPPCGGLNGTYIVQRSRRLLRASNRQDRPTRWVGWWLTLHVQGMHALTVNEAPGWPIGSSASNGRKVGDSYIVVAALSP